MLDFVFIQKPKITARQLNQLNIHNVQIKLKLKAYNLSRDGKFEKVRTLNSSKSLLYKYLKIFRYSGILQLYKFSMCKDIKIVLNVKTT